MSKWIDVMWEFLFLGVVSFLAFISLKIGPQRRRASTGLVGKTAFAVVLMAFGIPAFFIFMARGGLNALKPAVKYGIEIAVEFEVDGRVQVAKQGARCEVRDQRGSIAINAFAVDHEGSNPFLVLEDGRAFVVGGIDPCRWMKEPPRPGAIYRMVDLVEVNANGVGLPSREYAADELESRATLSRVDDVRSPRLVRAVELRVGTHGPLGATVRSITLTRNDSPEMSSAYDTLPYLAALSRKPQLASSAPLADRRARKSDEGTQEVIAMIYRVADACVVPPSQPEKWLAVDPSCRGRVAGYAFVAVTSDLTQLDVSAGVDASSPRLSVLERELLALGRGQYRNGGNTSDVNYVWTPRVCIEGDCAQIVDNRWYNGITLISPNRTQIVSVSISSGWVGTIAKDSQ